MTDKDDHSNQVQEDELLENHDEQPTKRDEQRKKIQEQKEGLDKKTKALGKMQNADALKRYSYLLGQTDLFSHFINVSKMKSSDASKFKDFVAQDTPKKQNDGSRRHRKTEKEEDAELLQEEDQDENSPFKFDESPSYVTGGTMRDYQVQGLNWLINLYENGINGILADEMGLGKTLQSISFLGYLKHYQQNDGPHLVIVPKSTLHNWVSEFKRWVPSLKAFMFHGDKPSRQELIQNILLPGDFEVCVTSYEMCLLEKSAFKRISWQYLMIDEAHRIKNENSALSQIVRLFNCRNRLLITGTPLQNNLHELWALLNFLLPDIFSSADDFNNWFANEQGEDQDKVVKQLHKVLSPFLLRRIKADVEKSLLPKKRINLYVGMSSMQRRWYQKLLEKDITAVNGAIGGKKEGKTRLQNIVMQLRKCCNHPYLFDGAEPGPPFTTDQHLVDNAGKMVILDKLLERLKAQGSRVLLFSQMSRMIDILEDYCVWKGFQYCRLDGNTNHEDRTSSIDEFNREGSEKFIFLLTTRAGGLGINLATADSVIMYDNDWNPQVDLQAEDRAHRIGQKKQVVIFRFITENAIEEKVIDRATQKLRLDQLVIQQGRQVASKSANKEELVSMIQYGAESIFQSSDSTIANEDIEEILARSEKKTMELESKYKDMGLEDLTKFSSEEKESAYQWEGEDFRDKNKQGLNWIGPAKRERKVNYDVDGYYQSQHLIGTRQRKERAPRVKAVNTLEYQFFNPRLILLQDREKYAHWKSVNYEPTKKDVPSHMSKVADQYLEEEKKKIAEAVPLTEEEIKEKESLSKEGFVNWTRKDFTNFCKACERHGRDNMQAICQDVEGKTPEEIQAYAKVFWERIKEIPDYEKIVSNIEKGEQRILKTREIQEAISSKVQRYRLPLQQMKLNYGQNKGKTYTEEEDRFLLVHMQKFGYGSDDMYDRIRAELKRSPLFRFDWFIKSRTNAELMRRCNTLVMLVQKEFESETKKRKDPAGEFKPPSKKKKQAPAPVQ
ncbi:SNF2 family N-terminal domain-containing protein [Gorgonomyces haynaldii]|nr:SNF2 family N-terminal domain-containing protein [Gorgonomyces haynaldii]